MAMAVNDLIVHHICHLRADMLTQYTLLFHCLTMFVIYAI